MIKKLENTEETYGTSFHGYTINSSLNKLSELFGNPYNVEDEKVNYEWNLTCNNIPFCLYDWKYFTEIEPEESIIWHIGTKTSEESEIIKKELDKIIN